MLYYPTLINLLETLLFILPMLLSVAFVTVAERKTMASMQRRLGPNIVGYYGLLQAFADALKLLLKEYVSPTQANLILFFLGPIITLVFSLLGYAAIPLAPGLSVFDFNIGILYMLAVSSLATYGILLAGWSANSKYAFLGSLRSTAQLISYELVISSAILLVVLVTSSLNLTVNVEIQKSVWLFVPLFPIFIVFFISGIAETNRAPFDLAEAESELVSGFMTEHSSVIFVFFFLAEYANIILICVLMSILFLGGYNLNVEILTNIINAALFASSYLLFVVNYIIFSVIDLYTQLVLTSYKIITYFDTNSNIANFLKITSGNYQYTSMSYILDNMSNYDFSVEDILGNAMAENSLCGLIIALKSFILVFIFIWIRASLPRLRYDQLMSYCWTVMLPIAFGFIVLIPCIIYELRIMCSSALFF